MSQSTSPLLIWTETFSDGEIYGMSGTMPFFTIAERENDFLLTSQLLESSISEGDDLAALKQVAESRFKVILKDSGLAPVRSLMKANMAELAKDLMWDAYSKYLFLTGDESDLNGFKSDFSAIIKDNELEGDALKYFKCRVKGILDLISKNAEKIDSERLYRRLLSKHMANHTDSCEREWLK